MTKAVVVSFVLKDGGGFSDAEGIITKALERFATVDVEAFSRAGLEEGKIGVVVLCRCDLMSSMLAQMIKDVFYC